MRCVGAHPSSDLPLGQTEARRAPVAFVLSENLHRRHLTQGQQAAVVASAQDWGNAQRHGGDRGNQYGPSQAATLPLATVAQRAAISGVSERTQRMADAVAKADPELAKKVAHGEVHPNPFGAFRVVRFRGFPLSP